MCLVITPVGAFITRTWNTRATLLVGVFFSNSRTHHRILLQEDLAFGPQPKHKPWLGNGFDVCGFIRHPFSMVSTKRSLASGFATCGSALGGLIYSLGTNSMIENIGLAWAFRILAIVSLVVNLGCSLLLRDRNAQTKSGNPKAFEMRLLRQFDFIMTLAWAILSLMAYTVVLFSIPDYGQSLGLWFRPGCTSWSPGESGTSCRSPGS